MQCACPHDHDDVEERSDDDMPSAGTPKAWEEEEPEEIVESDVELDIEGVVEGDDEPPQKVCISD